MRCHTYLRVFLISLLLGLFLGTTSCEKAPETTSENEAADAPEVQPTPTMPTDFEGQALIYVVAPLSGEDAAKGQAQAAGARLAAEEYNRQGGLFQRKIVVKILNDDGEPAGALDAAQHIAEALQSGEEIVGVILHEGSDPQLESVQQVYADLNLLTVVPASIDPTPAEIASPRFFRLSALNFRQASEIARVFREWNLADVALVHTATPYGQKLAQEFTQTAQELAVNTIESFAIEPNAASYSEVATRIQALNPAGVFFAGDDMAASVFLSNLFGFEFQGTVIGADRALSYTVIDELGCQAEGINFASMLPEPDTVMQSFQLAHYAEQEGRTAEPYTVAGYLGLEFIVRAYQQVETLDAEQAAAQARQKPVTTLIGELAFDAQGNLKEPRMHFFQVQSKAFQETFARQVGAEPQTAQDSAARRTTLLDKDFAAGKEPIIFADLNWNSALFGNSLARYMIESGYDQPTYATPGSSVPLFQSLRKGDLHVYMEAWLPNTQELYDQAIANQQVVDLGLYFGDAVQGWFVPRYVVEGDPDRGIEAMAAELKSIEDLKRYAHLFASEKQPGIGRLLDGSPGWFSYKIDCMKLKAYRLDDKYAQVTMGSGTALFNELNDAYKQGEPILVYLFGPSWPLAKFDLIQLQEPEFTPECWNTDKGCEFPLNQVKIVVHNSLSQQVPAVVDFLGKLQLQSDEISRVLLQMKEQDLTPQAAAIAWLKENESTWTPWVSAEAAQKIKRSLE